MKQSRRSLLQGAIASASLFACGAPASARTSFPKWVEEFRKRAHARGISDKTYDSVMHGLKPDTSVYALQGAQPEFKEQTWQYINRRCSDWRVINGKDIYKQNAALLEK